VEQQQILNEWRSGKALEYMKIDIDDPKLLEYMALYEKCKNEKPASHF
jgi:transmembrane sensor